MDKQEILQKALVAREEEIMGYQINIDNYTLALAHIDGLGEEERNEMETFRQQLSTLLSSEVYEQKKSKIMLSVIKQQLL